MKFDANAFLKKKLVDPVMQQLTQGVTARALAFSCALGFALGIFPILGSTTLLCLMAGVIFKLNQPVLQAVNYLAYPVQIPMVLVFVRFGEKIFNAPPVPLTPTLLVQEFSKGPSVFMAKYGMAGLHGIVAWSIVAPILIALLFFPLAALFEKVRRTQGIAKEAA